jgi:hypothetical protein
MTIVSFLLGSKKKTDKAVKQKQKIPKGGQSSN